MKHSATIAAILMIMVFVSCATSAPEGDAGMTYFEGTRILTAKDTVVVGSFGRTDRDLSGMLEECLEARGIQVIPYSPVVQTINPLNVYFLDGRVETLEMGPDGPESIVCIMTLSEPSGTVFDTVRVETKGDDLQSMLYSAAFRASDVLVEQGENE